MSEFDRLKAQKTAIVNAQAMQVVDRILGRLKAAAFWVEHDEEGEPFEKFEAVRLGTIKTVCLEELGVVPTPSEPAP